MTRRLRETLRWTVPGSLAGSAADGASEEACASRLRTRWWARAALILAALCLAAPTWPQSPSESDQQRPGPGQGRPGMRMPGGPGARRPTPPLPGGPGAITPAATPTPAPSAPAAAPTGAAPKPVSDTATPPAPNKLEVTQLQGGEKVISMEFYNLALDHFLRILSSAANVTIMRDQQLSDANFTVIAPEKVPLDVAFQILDSMLQSRDYALIKTGPGLYKIMPKPIAVRDGNLGLGHGSDPNDVPPSPGLITQIIPLKNLSAQEVAGEIAPVLSANTAITNVASTNSVIVTDTAANVNKALQIIQLLEGELSGGVKSIRVRYRDAAEVASIVQAIILNRGGGGGSIGAPGGRPIFERGVMAGAPGAANRPNAGSGQAGSLATSGGEYVYADARTNTLLVQATPLHFEQIQGLVAELDKRVDLTESVYIYPAQNLAAQDLAALVAPCIGATVTVVQPDGQSGPGGNRPGGGGGFPGQRNRSGNFRGGGGNRPYGVGSAGSTSLAAGTLEVEPAAAPSPLQVAQGEGTGFVPPTPPAPMEGGGYAGGGGDAYTASGIGTQPTITADPTTNTLLIMAPPEQLEMLKKVMGQLDVMPPQVYIQAIIAEVTLTKDNNLGFQWDKLTGSLRRNGNLFTGTFGTLLGVGGEDAAGLSGVIKGPGEFQAILNALASDSNAKVLSTPSIFTANNQQANINVSNQQYVPTSQITTTNGTPTVLTQVVPVDVGITLMVTPRVTQGDVVHMDVEVTADQPGPMQTVAGGTYQTIQQRQAQATLDVAAGNTIILGGLMRDTVSSNTAGVPILSKLPLVGALFRSRHSFKEKTELLVFLTPRVIRTPAEAQRLSEQERNMLPAIPRSLDRPLDQQGLEDLEAARAKEQEKLRGR